MADQFTQAQVGEILSVLTSEIITMGYKSGIGPRVCIRAWREVARGAGECGCPLMALAHMKAADVVEKALADGSVVEVSCPPPAADGVSN
jgi:hypothetical protein